MAVPYIPIDNDDVRFLVKGDYIKYKRKDSDKIKYGFMVCHWSKDNEEGLCLSFAKKTNSKKWSLKYSDIDYIEKKINPSFYFEYQSIMNKIKYG